jgi:Kef-type K+ transport system membrane component KefB
MTLQQEQALRNSLDEVDRKRRRSKIRKIAALTLVISDAVAIILWAIATRSSTSAADIRTTLALGLAGVILTVAVAAVKIEQVCYDNTRKILRAIELISESNRTMPSPFEKERNA